MRIVVLDGYTLNPGDISWNELASLGDFTVYNYTKPSEILEHIGMADAVFTVGTPLPAHIIRSAPCLKFIGVLSARYDHVDTVAAKNAGVVVCNVPNYSEFAASQFSIALLLELCHHIRQHSDFVLSGEWYHNPDQCRWHYPFIELRGKTMGILGFEQIGQMTSQIAAAMGMDILAYDRFKLPELENEHCHYADDLDEFFSLSDIISLHCPLFPSTRNIINRKNIAKMRDGVLIINSSHGGLIIEQDLCDALNSGKIAGAALDVANTEPLSPDSPLMHTKNLVITPHIACASKETRVRLLHDAYENLRMFFKGKPQNLVN